MLQALELLIGYEAAIDKSDDDNWTPLHAACKMGHTDVVDVLVLAGADVGRQAHDGMTCLYIAAYNGHGHVSNNNLKIYMLRSY